LKEIKSKSKEEWKIKKKDIKSQMDCCKQQLVIYSERFRVLRICILIIISACFCLIGSTVFIVITYYALVLYWVVLVMIIIALILFFVSAIYGFVEAGIARGADDILINYLELREKQDLEVDVDEKEEEKETTREEGATEKKPKLDKDASESESQDSDNGKDKTAVLKKSLKKTEMEKKRK